MLNKLSISISLKKFSLLREKTTPKRFSLEDIEDGRKMLKILKNITEG